MPEFPLGRIGSLRFTCPRCHAVATLSLSSEGLSPPRHCEVCAEPNSTDFARLMQRVADLGNLILELQRNPELQVTLETTVSAIPPPHARSARSSSRHPPKN